MDLEEMDLKWKMAMLSVRVHKFEQKAGRKIDFDKKESARFNKKKVRCYKCLQRGHFARECRAKGGKKKQVDISSRFKCLGRGRRAKALITVDTLVDWTEHDGQSDGVIAPKVFGMIAGCDSEDAIEEGAAKIYNLITGADTKEASTAGDAGEFALMGVTSEFKLIRTHLKLWKKHRAVLQKNQLTLEDKIRVLSIELENKSNSINILTKVGLGFNNYIRENELGWDDSAFSVFTTNSKEVEGRPLFNRFAKAESMIAVPQPLSGDFTLYQINWTCDKVSVVNQQITLLQYFSVKYSEPKTNDSKSCASTSSVSSSECEAEI
ncbi:ribonuclease H-like domain-containing protein [Tanacetum coccineum]